MGTERYFSTTATSEISSAQVQCKLCAKEGVGMRLDSKQRLHVSRGSEAEQTVYLSFSTDPEPGYATHIWCTRPDLFFRLSQCNVLLACLKQTMGGNFAIKDCSASLSFSQRKTLS